MRRLWHDLPCRGRAVSRQTGAREPSEDTVKRATFARMYGVRSTYYPLLNLDRRRIAQHHAPDLACGIAARCRPPSAAPFSMLWPSGAMTCTQLSPARRRVSAGCRVVARRQRAPSTRPRCAGSRDAGTGRGARLGASCAAAGTSSGAPWSWTRCRQMRLRGHPDRHGDRRGDHDIDQRAARPFDDPLHRGVWRARTSSAGSTGATARPAASVRCRRPAGANNCATGRARRPARPGAASPRPPALRRRARASSAARRRRPGSGPRLRAPCAGAGRSRGRISAHACRLGRSFMA